MCKKPKKKKACMAGVLLLLLLLLLPLAAALSHTGSTLREYCEYSPDFNTHCLPWLLANHPEEAKRLFGQGGEEAGGDGCSSGAAEAEPSTVSSAADEQPAGADEPAPAVLLEPWSTKERLTQFYTKYVPEKVADVDKLLLKYEGKEENLFTALSKKYGPEPIDPYLAAKYGITDEGDDSQALAAGVGGIQLAQKDAAGEKSENSACDDQGGEGAAAPATKKKVKARGASAKTTKKLDTRIIIQKINR